MVEITGLDMQFLTETVATPIYNLFKEEDALNTMNSEETKIKIATIIREHLVKASDTVATKSDPAPDTSQ